MTSEYILLCDSCNTDQFCELLNDKIREMHKKYEDYTLIYGYLHDIHNILYLTINHKDNVINTKYIIKIIKELFNSFTNDEKNIYKICILKYTNLIEVATYLGKISNKEN